MVLVCSYVVVRVFLGVSRALLYGCYGVLIVVVSWVVTSLSLKSPWIQYIVVTSLVKMECAVLNAFLNAHL